MALTVSDTKQSVSFIATLAALTGALLGGSAVYFIQRQHDSRTHHDSQRPAKSPRLSAPSTSGLSIESADDSASSNKRKNGRRTLQDEMLDGSLVVQTIGTVESIYRLCVGTPRQGLLAPHARGRIVLDRLNDASSAQNSVDGLEGYSHIWVIFVFHLNTTSRKKASKIAPPALGGAKIGVLATRSPHRFNPVGISLVRLDQIRKIRRDGKVVVCLDISGLDLVDGTPVLDIKPYVGHYDAPIEDGIEIRVPRWVAGGLATKRTVEITDGACESIRSIITTEGSASLGFFGSAHGENAEDGYQSLLKCIEEVLSMDVRSAYQTKKAREGKSQAERASRMQNTLAASSTHRADDHCTQQIDNLLVHFKVVEASTVNRMNSEGSGAEDRVVVTSVEFLASA